MNEAGMLQIPDSRYCFATDRNDLVIHLRIAKEDKDAKVFLVYGDKFEYHDKQSEKEIEIAYQDKTYVYYEVKQHVTDRRFAYIFRFEVEGRSYYFSEDGLTESYDFPNSFYNFFQMPYINEVDIHRPIPWLKDAVFYQIFVDRFAQGDFDKDQSYIDMAWGDKPTPSHFAGGDLKGIIQKLDYLSDLGIKAIYLTPIFLSPTNNKYDIIDYYRVDPQFGSLEDLKTLVTKAHQMGIRVILDAVFNHCSVLAPQFQDVLDKGRESVFYDWFMIEGDYPNPDLLNYETFASCHYMPKWNTSNPKVQDFLISVGLYWIKEADIDGWRLDVSDEVSHQFWRDFRRAVKATKEDCVLIGENWHDAYPYLAGDQYDSIMNYAFTKVCLDTFAFNRFSAENLSHQLNNILMRNTDAVNRMNLNLLDSHDTHRIFTQVGKSTEKLLAALALAMVFPGVPCLYYGTELAMEGGYDPDSRRTFNWQKEEWNMAVLEQTKALIRLKELAVIQEGDIRITYDKDLLRVSRLGKVQRLDLLLNLGQNPLGIEVKDQVIMANGLDLQKQVLAPFGFIIITKEKTHD